MNGKINFKFILSARKLFPNPLSANPTKQSNRLKQFVGNLPTICLSVFGHFVGFALKGLTEALTTIHNHLICKKPSLNKKMKFPIDDFLSKCDQICSFLWIGHIYFKESLMENFIFLQ